MNLFWKNLLGKITPAEVLEAREKELVVAMKRYEDVSKSLELEEYNKLYHIVKAASFVEKKKTLQNRKYKDTEEFKTIKRHNKLHHSPKIKQYLEVLKSSELKLFLEFKTTPDYEKLGNKKEISESPILQKHKLFEKSANYKVYCRFHESYIIKEYYELQLKIEDKDFKLSNAFWSNANRWQTTPEYKQEQRFFELEKNSDIVFYINEKPERFEVYKKQIVSFEDRFNWNSLNKSSWNFGFHYKNPKTIRNHSFANEKQANNDGKNVHVKDGSLNIVTKKETVTARAWDQSKGFVMKDFEYSSDVLQTALEFRQKGGVFMAKIRCSGNVNHAFWLGSDGKLPHINIFHFDGKKIRVGNAYQNIFDGVNISGLNPSKYHIYSLRWAKNELVWMINDIEVYRTTGNIPNEEMYLAFNSFIPQKSRTDEGLMEIDWVRVYR
jgi:hypothetical protein